MRNLLSLDNPVMQLITKIVTSVYLNILWFICCLPIFTIGASTTALFYVTLKMVKNEEGNITKAFFHSFKENFKQGTTIWMILLGFGIVLGLDGYVLYHMRFENVFWTLNTAVFFVVLAAYAIILMYIFPLLSRFNNSIKVMFKNSIIIGMRFLLCTALMVIIYSAMAFIVINIFTPAIIFGEGLCALLCSYVLSNVLLLCEGKSEPSHSEDETVIDTDGETSIIHETYETEDVHEKLAERNFVTGKKKLRSLHGKEKLQYIWDYYKLHLTVLCILLYIIGYTIYGHFSHKDIVLYTALVNVTTSEALTEELSIDFLRSQNINISKNELYLYSNLYLTDNEANPDHQYSYASRMKILASIDAEQLDVVLMNKEAFDAFSQNGYLCNLEELLTSKDYNLYEKLSPYLISNTAILEDNSLDLYFDKSQDYQATTEEYPMAFNLSYSPIISAAGFEDTVYLGVIANSPRKDSTISYIEYLFNTSSEYSQSASLPD